MEDYYSIQCYHHITVDVTVESHSNKFQLFSIITRMLYRSWIVCFYTTNFQCLFMCFFSKLLYYIKCLKENKRYCKHLI